MRIFETHQQLRAALDLPALDAGAYRFTAQYGKAGFQCAQCGAVRVFPLNNGLTGYGVQHGQMFCYECCTANEVERMRGHKGPFYAYLNSKGDKVTSWPGGELARVHCLGSSRAGWHGSKIYRFHALDNWGKWWQGRGAGEGMFCTLRPMKAPDYAKHWGRV